MLYSRIKVNTRHSRLDTVDMHVKHFNTEARTLFGILIHTVKICFLYTLIIGQVL